MFIEELNKISCFGELWLIQFIVFMKLQFGTYAYWVYDSNVNSSVSLFTMIRINFTFMGVGLIYIWKVQIEIFLKNPFFIITCKKFRDLYDQQSMLQYHVLTFYYSVSFQQSKLEITKSLTMITIKNTFTKIFHEVLPMNPNNSPQ